MPIYTKLDKALLFMHIPKTGGTSIEDWLKTQEKFKEYLFMKHPPNDLLCTPQHFTYATIESLFFPIFTKLTYQFAIVRNPYDRIESEFFYRQKLGELRIGKHPEKYFSSWVCKILKEAKTQPNLLDNHLRPQAEFITEKVDTYYFENGVFNIMNQVAEKINIGKPNNVIHKKSSIRKPVYWSIKAINLVNDFYKNDFESFNYQQKPKTNRGPERIKGNAYEIIFKVRGATRIIWRHLKRQYVQP